MEMKDIDPTDIMLSCYDRIFKWALFLLFPYNTFKNKNNKQTTK